MSRDREWYDTRRIAPVLLVGMVSLLGLTGCNGSAGPTAVAPGQDPVSTRIGNLLAFNSTEAPPGGSGGRPGLRIDCPIIQVEPGGAAFRVGTGDSANVRYQISIGDVARDCALVGDKLAIRVGVETTTVLGPAGTPGTYTAPLRITVRRQLDETILASKTYRVGGAVGAGGPAQSSLVADALTVPYTSERAVDDYEVVIGFGEGAGAGRRGR